MKGEKVEKKTTGRTIFRITVLIASFSLLSKLLGLVRDIVIGRIFGASSATDAYLQALSATNMFFFIISGALAAVAVPIFIDYVTKGKKREAWQVFNSVFNAATLIFIGIAVLGILFAPYMIKIVGYALEEETAALAAELARIMFPMLIFAGWASLFAGLLNANKVFGIPAFSNVLNNAVIIVGAVTLGSWYGIHGVALGTILAMAAMALIQVPALFRAGYRYKPAIDLRDPGVIKVFTLMLPATLGLAVNQGYILIERNLASGMLEGTITMLSYANKLVQFPVSILVLALVTAVFPTISKLAAAGEREAFSAAMNRLLKVLALGMIPASLGLIVLREPLVALLFQGGNFTAAAAQGTAIAVFFYAVGLTGQAANVILTKAFHSFQDTKTPVKITLVTILANLCFSLWLSKILGHGGLALASSLASLLGTVLFMGYLKRKIAVLRWSGLGKHIFLVFVASALMVLACYSVITFLPDLLALSGRLGLLLQVIVATTVGVAVFIGVAWLLKIEELAALFGYLRSTVAGRNQKK